MCDASSPIIIEGVVSDVPDDLVAKYSNHLRGITTDGRLIDDMESDEAIDAQEVLTVRLTIGRDLEPLWEVVSYNGIEPSIIKATDRGKLNVYMAVSYTHLDVYKRQPVQTAQNCPIYTLPTYT